jgi:hypothetical protein
VLVELTTWKVSRSVSLERKMRLRESERLDLPSSDILPSEYICVYQAAVVHALSRMYSFPLRWNCTGSGTRNPCRSFLLEAKRPITSDSAPYWWK